MSPLEQKRPISSNLFSIGRFYEGMSFWEGLGGFVISRRKTLRRLQIEDGSEEKTVVAETSV